jgi:cell division protein FtsL
MNAAAKDMSQSDFFHGHLVNMRLSKNMCLNLALQIGVLISALGVVYSTNLNRTVLNQLEQAEQQNHQLKLQWGQLLLEQASLATPSRVQEMAAKKLHMTLPDNQQTFVLRAR